MNWQEFNDQVRIFLIVDSERKGRGVQENIDSLIVASVVDLQRYIPAIRQNQYKFYSDDTLVEPNPEDLSDVNNEGVDVHKGDFAMSNVRVKQVLVRRVATSENGQDISRYYYPNSIPWESRFTLIDGGVSERTANIPGRITFGENKFWTAPKLRSDEALYIYFEGEFRPTPIYRATDDEKNTPVIFDEMEAKASAGYVKAHLARDVDNDLAQYQAYMQMYQKERAQIFINRKEYQTSSIEQIANSTGIGGSEFVIG
jgi:hypothetical protein